MGGDRPDDLEELVRDALGLPPDALPAFVRAACRGDAQRERVLTEKIQEATRTQAPAQSAAAAAPLPQLRGYRVQRQVGHGGQGQVYVAVQEATGQRVAIKLLSARFPSPSDLARFKAEAAFLSGLIHPNIPRVFDSGEIDGQPYLIMEYISGDPLDRYAQRNRLAPLAVARLMIDVCGAVGSAHAAGVIHRDLKPSNILVTGDGCPKLLDFGLAKSIWLDRWHADANTQTGMFQGSLPWASPEQAAGRPTQMGPQSDVYSLGVILYQLLAGTFPYPVDGSLHQVTRTICETDPLPLRKAAPQMPRSLAAIVHRCLEKKPSQRYPNGAALAKDLDLVARGLPPETPSVSTVQRLVTRTRRLARSNVALSVLLLTLIMPLLMQPLMMLLVQLAPTQLWLQRTVMALAPPVLTSPPVYCRLITVGKSTTDKELAALALKFGVEGVDATELRSRRRLWGYLLKQLALATPRIVVLDLFFDDDSPHDTELRAGAQALRDESIPVVVGVADWRLNLGEPFLATELRDLCRWGALVGWPKDMIVGFALLRTDGTITPSLSLAALAAWWQPAALPIYQIDANARVLTIRFVEPPTPGAAEKGVGQPVEVPFTQLSTKDEMGAEPGELVADVSIKLHTPAALEPVTWTIAEVLAMNPQTLARHFQDKAVFIADERNDLHAFGNGPKRPGVLAHVAVFEMLAGRGPMVLIRGMSLAALPLVSALGVLGGALLVLTAPRRWHFALWVALFLSGGIIASLGLGILFDVYLNPAAPVAACAIGVMCGLILDLRPALQET